MELTLDQALQKGIEAHKAGKAQEADQYYTAILKANPKHPDANHNMGVLAVGVGKVEAALPFFKTALEANPNIAQFWLSYIDALIKLNRMDDAKVDQLLHHTYHFLADLLLSPVLLHPFDHFQFWLYLLAYFQLDQRVPL